VGMMGVGVATMLGEVVKPLLGRKLRHHRRRRGLCHRCGYDLTGNTSGRCPECASAVVIPPGHCLACGYVLTGNRTGRCPTCGLPTCRTRSAMLPHRD
jgi:predicted Zn-ribbon and HTH transcriptional regulator